MRESAPDVARPFEHEDDDETRTIDQGSKALLGQFLAENKILIDSNTVVTEGLNTSRKFQDRSSEFDGHRPRRRAAFQVV